MRKRFYHVVCRDDGHWIGIISGKNKLHCWCRASFYLWTHYWPWQLHVAKEM